MLHDIDTLSARIDAHAASLITLAEALEAAAAALRQDPAPPDEALLLRLQEARTTSLTLCAAVRDAAQQDGDDAQQAAAPDAAPASLQALRQTLHRIRAARAARQAALGAAQALLSRVARLACRDALPDLDAALAEAARLARSLSERSPEVRPLLAGVHPLAALLRLVEEDGLDDQRWNELQEIVGRSLGRSLAARAARGGLALLREEGPRSTPPRPLAPASVPVPAPAQLTEADLAALIQQDRVGLAYHLANGAGPSSPLPPALLRALALCPLLRSPWGEAAADLARCVQRLPPALENLAEDPPFAEDGPMELLRFALCLRPALRAPGSGVARLLPAIPEGRGPLLDLQRALRGACALGALGVDLSPELIRNVRDPASWPGAIAAIGARCRAFRSDQEAAQLPCPDASTIWMRWLEDSGPLYPLLTAVIRDERARTEEVRAALTRLTTWPDLQALITLTDRQARGAMADLLPLGASSLRALRLRTEEALLLCWRWLSLVTAQARPDEALQAERCFSLLTESLPGAAAEIRQLAAPLPGSPLLDAGLAAAMRALVDLETLLDPAAQEMSPAPDPRHALCAELLHLCPCPPLSSEWEPVGPLPLPALLELARTSPRMQASFQRHLAAGDHVATGRALEVLRGHVSGESDESDELAARRNQALAGCRDALRGELAQLAAEIERAAAEGQILPERRLALRAVLQSVAPEEVLDFPAAQARLVSVRAQLRQQREDLLRALGSAAAQEGAHEIGHGSALRAFFPGFVRQAAVFAQQARRAEGARQLVEDVRARRAVGPLRLERVSPEAAESAARLLRCFYDARAQHDVVEAVKGVLGGLGFEVTSCAARGPGGGHGPGKRRDLFLEARTAPLGDAARCPLPHHGSQAEGRYRVFCAWEPIFETELLELASRGGGKTPLLCLCLGYLAEARRLELLRLCRERGQPLLVLDEALVLFLCTLPAPRLGAFFRCAGAFAAVDPYPAAPPPAALPPELFFGRERELRELLAQSAEASLLFGGRRAGKTALLRELERRAGAADPGEGKLLIRYVDLRAEGLGQERPIEDLPAVLAGKLGRAGRRPQEWLDAEPGRRIVLLLDEADALLEADRRGGYAQVEQLRDLMERTAHRYKVVLCGGHQVARLARDPGSPRAHLGGALALGTLAGGDGRAALSLLRGPLEAAGALFASPELPWLLIARADGDPGILQVAGRQLAARLAGRQGPPFLLSAEDVAQVLDGPALRAAEAERQRTLDLDARYRPLVLLLASRCAAQPDARIEGVEAAWVHEAAHLIQGPHPAGDLRAVRDLLEELVALGVLRRVGSEVYARYALRGDPPQPTIWVSPAVQSTEGRSSTSCAAHA